MGKVMALAMVASLSLVTASFAQWGDFGGGGFGGGGFGGFGGDQNGGGSAEYSEKFADLNYAGDGKEYHNLDIYLPKEAKDSYPVVIHTYGSAWSMNNSKGSADINTICAGFLKAGFAVVTPNHRSASDAIYPAQLHDLKAVVRFIRGNAAKYKIDTNFIAMSGFSSGGHLSSLTATTCGMKEGKSGSVTVDLEGSLGEFTKFSSCIDAACLWSPPTDIYTMNPINSFGGSGTFEGAFIGAEREGNKDKWMVASSPYYVDENDPPIILFHGTSDQVVNIEQSQELYDSLQHHGVESEFVKVSGGTHGGSEMYVAANLDKAVSFFNKAKEAKASKAPATDPAKENPSTDPAKENPAKEDPATNPSEPASSDSIGEVVVKPVANDTINVEASALRGAASRSTFSLSVQGNVVYVQGSPEVSFKYKVVSVNGSYTDMGNILQSIDLSVVKPGVYCVIVSAANGERQMVRFVKK